MPNLAYSRSSSPGFCHIPPGQSRWQQNIPVGHPHPRPITVFLPPLESQLCLMKTLFIPSLWAELLLQPQDGAISFSFRHLPIFPPKPTNGYHLNACHLFSKDICHSSRSLEKPGQEEAWDRHELLFGHNETVWGRAPAISPLGKGPAGESPRACLLFILCRLCWGRQSQRERVQGRVPTSS